MRPYLRSMTMISALMFIVRIGLLKGGLLKERGHYIHWGPTWRHGSGIHRLGVTMRYLADNRGGYLIRVKRSSTGFSLTEMLMVLFIVALVAVLTWPSY